MTIIVIFYCIVFIGITLIDWKYRIIPNKVIYPTTIAALFLNYFMPSGIVYGAIGGLVGFIFLALLAAQVPTGIGMGDVKLAGLVGLVTGFPSVVMALVISFLLAGLWVAVCLLTRVNKLKGNIPFAPFLSSGAILTLFWGSQIISLIIRA